jgi:hypothetical protein
MRDLRCARRTVGSVCRRAERARKTSPFFIHYDVRDGDGWGQKTSEERGRFAEERRTSGGADVRDEDARGGAGVRTTRRGARLRQGYGRASAILVGL